MIICYSATAAAYRQHHLQGQQLIIDSDSAASALQQHHNDGGIGANSSSTRFSMSATARANAAAAASKLRGQRQWQQHLRRSISIQRQHQPQHYLRGGMRSAYAPTSAPALSDLATAVTVHQLLLQQPHQQSTAVTPLCITFSFSIWQLGGGGVSITEVGDEGGGAGKHGDGEDGETRGRGRRRERRSQMRPWRRRHNPAAAPRQRWLT
jgi:hypothetical protein